MDHQLNHIYPRARINFQDVEGERVKGILIVQVEREIKYWAALGIAIPRPCEWDGLSHTIQIKDIDIHN